jgi:hypothetical protein
LEPNAVEKFRTDLDVKTGQLVAADIFRQSPCHHGNGPFLRLTDGSGWVFENKQNERMMRPVHVQKGKWTLRVENSDDKI